LIGVDEEGNVIESGNIGGAPELSAKCIHIGIRQVRPDAKVRILESIYRYKGYR
jgi:hypothetical protein